MNQLFFVQNHIKIKENRMEKYMFYEIIRTEHWIHG